MTTVDLLSWPVAALGVTLAIWVTVHAVLQKRDARAAIAWTGLAWLAPIWGSLVYYVFGINRIHRKAVRLGVKDALQGTAPLQLVHEEIQLLREASETYPHLAGLEAVGATLSQNPLLPGNTITHLRDGDETYPAMLEEISRAKVSIGLMSYIFDYDRAGERFLEALTEAKGRGVQVRVLIDGVGGFYSKQKMVELLRERGVDAAHFLPTSFGRISEFTNLRNHRKILVVDGRVGFTGGTNIREGHCLTLSPQSPVQCLHFRLEGPVVSQIQEAFVTDWAFATGETLTNRDWFPQPERSGHVWARGISHGPDEDFEALSTLLFAAISVARERVRIVSPYFLPNNRLIEALVVAAMRGVDVEVFVPSNNNVPLVEWAATADLAHLIAHGCRVYVTAPPFDHTKLMIVDDVWSLIGSTNWDPRSLRLNFEFNVECYDIDLAQSLHEIVDAKADGAREMTLDEINARSFPVRLRDGLSRLLSPYL